MKSSTLISLLFFFSHNSEACRQLNWSVDEYAVNSNLVYVGLVHSISIPKPEKSIDLDTYRNTFHRSGDTEVALKIIKTLKGKDEDNLSISLNSCRGGQYELGDIVVAYKLGKLWHVKNTKEEVNQSIKALTSSKTKRSLRELGRADSARPF